MTADKAKDECGIVGVYNLDPASQRSVTSFIPSALLDLQHRGQLAAGMTRFDPDGAHRLLTHKDTGSMREVFRLTHRAKAKAIVDEHAGSCTFDRPGTRPPLLSLCHRRLPIGCGDAHLRRRA